MSLKIKEGSKVLTMNVCFLLPDDFEGTYEDAIREYLKYRQEKDLSPSMSESKGKVDVENVTIADVWNGFLDSLNKGYRFHGSVAYSKYVDGEWTLIGD